jgi:hypothetical protein
VISRLFNLKWWFSGDPTTPLSETLLGVKRIPIEIAIVIQNNVGLAEKDSQ